MNFTDMDQPLGDEFYSNPYEFLQSFVRNMNNEIFLSEYQLHHLYALLLLKKKSPWDDVKPNNQNMKSIIEEIVNQKLGEVKKILQGLSQIYQNRVKKSSFGQIQKLMNIIKAKNKSIYIQKDMEQLHRQHRKQRQQKKLQKQLKQKLEQTNPSLIQQKPFQNEEYSQCPFNQINIVDIKEELISSRKEKEKKKQQQEKEAQTNGDQREVLSLFYGLTNLPNLSTLALSNCLEFSASERYIKFKMSKNYIMTIKNDDLQNFDQDSTLKEVSSDIFTNHIFSYLTAVQLFKSRAVCRQWMSNVKQSWHSTFKREMFVQLMACQFCKEIQYYYKLIQLRNPFFQKISLLMHALLQIIQWDKVIESIQNNSIVLLQKRVLIILLKLTGEQIEITNPNSITEEIWNLNKQKILNIKQRVSSFLNNMNSTVLSVHELIRIKVNLLDDPFIRIDEINSQDKTPLLLVIFIKQMTLQQTLKNHIFFSQEYLMNTKKRLDDVSSKMPQQKGFLQGVYKILLLRNMGPTTKSDLEQGRGQMPDFQKLWSSIFSNSQQNKPDFTIKNKSNSTNIFFDKATKLDIIVSTVRKIKSSSEDVQEEPSQDIQEKSEVIQKESHKQLKTISVYNLKLNNPCQNKSNKSDFQQMTNEEDIKQEQEKQIYKKEQ